MTQFLLLIQGNLKSPALPEEWNRFFEAARESGLFKGGSKLGNRWVLGDASSPNSSAHSTGYMRFDAGDRQQVLDLLRLHPVLIHGGTMELFEMPQC